MSDVEFRGVTKRFSGDTTAVDALDLEVKDGELMVLVGSWERYPIATILGVFGLVIGATYLLRMVKTAWLGPLNPRWEGLRDARGLLECSPFLVLLGVLLVFGFYPAPIVDLIESGVTPIVQAVLAAEAGLGG